MEQVLARNFRQMHALLDAWGAWDLDYDAFVRLIKTQAPDGTKRLATYGTGGSGRNFEDLWHDVQYMRRHYGHGA